MLAGEWQRLQLSSQIILGGGLAELEGKSASKSQSKTRQKVSRNNAAQGTLAQAASRTDQAKAQVKRNKRIIEAQKKERSKGKKK